MGQYCDDDDGNNNCNKCNMSTQVGVWLEMADFDYPQAL